MPGFTFSVQEVADFSGIGKPSIVTVLNAFTKSEGEKNQYFRALNDFNVANATPLLRLDDVNFVLFQGYSLVEALYESPFYWMGADKTYTDTAMRNRGRFTEEFCRDRLELVFGKERVFTNVDIFESKEKLGEIDVLVIFGNRIIVVQAKSKRLTLEARKGNDLQIKDDFKKSVQDSYEQGLTCAKSLGVSKYKLVDANSRVITVPKGLMEIYILCVVSDHYPALSFQTRQFLKYETTESIQPPLVLDIFALDAMTEMLSSPLHFLSYVNQRANYTDKLLVSHELTILSYHLKNNLWLNDEHDMVMLGDDISADLDVAMAVRRDGVNGKSTPDGILTRFKSTVLGCIVNGIESMPDPGTIDLGFLLLTLSEETVLDVSRGIDKLAQLAFHDHKHHDLTVGLESASTGLTIHINEEPVSVAGPHLQGHCERRKYSQKATSWFGICISPTDKALRFGLCLKYEWRQNAKMELVTRNMPKSGNFLESIGHKKHKVGRNDPCTCGSGMKFKKCCIGK
ncbi:nuclease-related domain-containing protein [Geobacter argillaceus]|uniref:Nuclease-like protein n=1 Tax=Geobacter argillaceus TaxID=345631 RepID=A0A562VMC2_9BACT|nr:nuclease-related domain-containing protein [Geobacter argillaceus]TWJ18924.1 nuclease-like protein [Geobacter argillaceus]